MVASPSDQELIDSLNIPIITNAGTIGQAIPPAMILFLDKNNQITEDNIWKAILDKKAVALFEKGKLTGPKEFVDPLKDSYAGEAIFKRTIWQSGFPPGTGDKGRA